MLLLSSRDPSSPRYPSIQPEMKQTKIFQDAITVGIIGSAGRKQDAKKMTSSIYEAMLTKTEKVISEQFELELKRVRLVSGGAAWADHVAVTLHLMDKVGGLTLHLPAQWHQDDTNPQFHDNEDRNIYKNPGRSANRLHQQFTKKIGKNSLQELSRAKTKGARFSIHNGFKERNTAVAGECQYLIAYTWNDGESPKSESGTHDTWMKHSGTKVHISLGGLTPCCRPVAGEVRGSKCPSTGKERTKAVLENGSQGDSDYESLPPSWSDEYACEAVDDVETSKLSTRKRNHTDSYSHASKVQKVI